MPHLLRRGGICASALAVGIIIGTGDAWSQDEAALELGQRVFTTEAKPKCSICHTLADAGAAGEIGPNLDELKPGKEKVRTAVTQGFEAMPPYGGTLTDEQIEAVSSYVAAVAGKGG